MRIAFLPSSYLPESVGGTELYVHNLSLALSAAGHQVSVVYHAENPGQSFGDGYEVYRLAPHLPQKRAENFFCNSKRDPPGFDEFLNRWRPDAVHFHALTLGAGLDHSRVLRRHGIPYFITYHTPTFSCQRGTLMRWGKEVCDGNIRPHTCAACTLQGQGLPRPLAELLAASPLPHARLPEGPWTPRLALKSLFAGRLPQWLDFMQGAGHIVACAKWCRDVLIGNGISESSISVHRQALPGDDRTRVLKLPLGNHRPLRLGFFGRFTWIKGPDLLLEAAGHLTSQGMATRVELVGPIPVSERPWADKLLVASTRYAAYLGIKRDSALTDWLDSLDLIVIPSRWLETGPLTLLEAWDRGVPVVGANFGGISDFMGAAGQESLLFDREDSKSLAGAIVRALEWRSDERPEVSIDGMTKLACRMEEMYVGCGQSCSSTSREFPH